MKKLAVLMIAAGALLSGCVGYDTPVYDSRPYAHSSQPAPQTYYYRDAAPQTYYYRDGRQYSYSNDRDGDGVRNRNDRSPDNPYRY